MPAGPRRPNSACSSWLRAAPRQLTTWLALAFARVNLDQAEAALAAVDQALALEPRNIRALLFKADHLDRMGQPRVALGFYQAALRVAAGMPQVPADVARGMERAQEVCDRWAAEYEDYLLEAMETAGFTRREQPRFAESLDIACGKVPVQLQQPTRYYFPGLPQRAFYERGEFAWAAGLEAHTAAIRAELLGLMAGPELFEPYLESDPARPRLNDSRNFDSMDWSACYLLARGHPGGGGRQSLPPHHGGAGRGAPVHHSRANALSAVFQPGARGAY